MTENNTTKLEDLKPGSSVQGLTPTGAVKIINIEWFGGGRSFGFADPETGIGFAYVMNNMAFCVYNDHREKALRDAVFGSLYLLSQQIAARLIWRQ